MSLLQRFLPGSRWGLRQEAKNLGVGALSLVSDTHPLGAWFTLLAFFEQLASSDSYSRLRVLMAVTPFQRTSIHSVFPARKYLSITYLFQACLIIFVRIL